MFTTSNAPKEKENGDFEVETAKGNVNGKKLTTMPSKHPSRAMKKAAAEQGRNTVQSATCVARKKQGQQHDLSGHCEAQRNAMQHSTTHATETRILVRTTAGL